MSDIVENKSSGKVVGVNGNMVTIEVEGNVLMNEVGYVVVNTSEGVKKLKAEVIRIKGKNADMQVYEMTRGIGVGDKVELTGEMLAVTLGPGLLGQVFDGLQNPLPKLAEHSGFFLERGVYLDALPGDKKWHFTPCVKAGDTVQRADSLGVVPEGIFQHQIMVPFGMYDTYTVKSIASEGDYTVNDKIAEVADSKGNVTPLTMCFTWPVKRAIDAYTERLKPVEPMITKVRLIDTFFPVAKGGTYCIPGPFGAGKTVLQQITSKNAEVDIVIVAACGERAGEVVEELKEFPELTDPRTGRSLMERTMIICNTSSMPVAAREASVYTAVTLGEYYRQMGLNVLLLADSTSRWAQAKNGKTGSVTIGGTVSPAGGNFEEPVTQATLKVVGAFHGLSRERSDARKYPAIHPLESWSKYKSGIVGPEYVEYASDILIRGNDVGQMMKVVGEEGTSIDDYITYLKEELLDAVYIQQNSFDEVDAAVPVERQQHVFYILLKILAAKFSFTVKDEARSYFNQLRQIFLDYNGSLWGTDAFKAKEKELLDALASKQTGVEEKGAALLANIK